MLLTYLAVTVISIRADVNQTLASFQEHLRDLNVYMKREKVSEDLRRYHCCYVSTMRIQIILYFVKNKHNLIKMEHSTIIQRGQKGVSAC